MGEPGNDSAVLSDSTRPTVRRAHGWLRHLLSHKGVSLGGGLLLAIFALALLAPLIAPFDPYDQNLSRRLIPPVWFEKGSWEHPFGTDGFGRDYLTRILYGARTSLFVGITGTALAMIIGTFMGVVAGYFGGRVDMIVTFLITTRLSLPLFLTALAIVAIVGNSIEILILAIGLLIWDRFAVVMRAATQQTRQLDYVAAARAVGCSTPRILFGEILPNVASALIVVATLEVAHAILLSAALSFLGLGVQPPTPDWGLMIAEGKPFMFFDGWLIALPGAALFILILSMNLLGDGIRDITAPDQRH